MSMSGANVTRASADFALLAPLILNSPFAEFDD